MIGKMIGLISTVLLCCAIVSTSLAQTCTTDGRIPPPSTPSVRFTDNGDGTVTHHKTGLMWAKCAEGLSGADCASGTAYNYTWDGALEAALASRLAGKSDWRLPNIKELQSIVEEQCTDPAINLAVFPNTPASYFWSASPVGGNMGVTWYVHFTNGYAGYNYRYVNLYLRLVRSVQ